MLSRSFQKPLAGSNAQDLPSVINITIPGGERLRPRDGLKLLVVSCLVSMTWRWLVRSQRAAKSADQGRGSGGEM